MFPVEIWEEILKYVRARDLARFRTVCRTLDAIIEPILQREDIWYRQCAEDIPENLWISLLEHQNDPDFEYPDFHNAANNSQIWLNMYKSWRGWQTIIKKTPMTETFGPLPQHRHTERITCVAALNNVIAFGSSEGYITFYGIDSGRILYIADNIYLVENIQLMKKGNIMIAVSSLKNKTTKFWNITQNAEVTSLRCCRSMITATSFGHGYMINNNRLTQYRLAEFPLDEVDGNGKTRKCTQLVFNTNPDLVEGLLEQGDKLEAAGANGNQVLLCTAKNKQSLITCENEETNQEKLVQIEPPQMGSVRYYRIFNGRVVACFGTYGEFGFSVNGGQWKIYNLCNKFSAPVTTFLFHVGFLALGLESGQVHLFPIKDVENLTDLDFEKIESRKLLLDTKPIISLNVTECDSHQYLVATTVRLVHLVKFI